MARSGKNIEVSKALQLAAGWTDRILSDLVTLSEIPAPLFEERRRGEILQSLMERSGFNEVETDGVGNVIGVRSGGGKKAILISAHLDTVFPREMDHTVRIDAHKAYGPGVGDNSLGLATMLAIVEVLNRLEVETNRDLILVGTVGGEGNLHGMRALMRELGNEIGYAVSLEGHNLGRVDYVSVGNIRLRICCQTRGGHSWRDYGSSNAIVALNRLINGLLALEIQDGPRTTLNLGLIGGGVAYDTISPRATLGIEIRSEGEDELAKLESQIYDAAARVGGIERCRMEVDEISRRPGAGIRSSHPLVKEVLAIHRRLGIRSILGSGSSGGSIPLSLGIPTVTLGLTFGQNEHLPEENIEIEPMIKGLSQVLWLIAALDEQTEG